MNPYPQSIVPVGHIEPVPRRVRGTLGGRLVFDTVDAKYVWEWPHYPLYYIPLEDVTPGVLIYPPRERSRRDDSAEHYGIRSGTAVRLDCARAYPADDPDGRGEMVRFDWDALDSWFEEDEQIFKHPRSPYARVDAVRSTRKIRIGLEGLTLAETSSPVMVFETGLPTRYYVNRTEVDFGFLTPSETVSACPYKGTTSQYWNVRVGDVERADLAWSYDFPTREMAPIAGLIAFYNEKVDLDLDGVRLPRPETLFSVPKQPTLEPMIESVGNDKR